MASASDLRSDTESLTEIIEQASLALDTVPDLHPSLASVRESLAAAFALSRDVAKSLSEMKTPADMGAKGGAVTRDRKEPGYFSELAKARKTKAGGRPRKTVASQKPTA